MKTARRFISCQLIHVSALNAELCDYRSNDLIGFLTCSNLK